MPTIKSPSPVVAARSPSASVQSPVARSATGAPASQGWQPKPAAAVSSSGASSRPAHELRRFEISVPSDRTGESLSVLNGFVTTGFDDVTLKMGKKTILGLETRVELLGIGSAAELDKLQGVIRRTVDANAGPGTPIQAEHGRFVPMDDPSVPRP